MSTERCTCLPLGLGLLARDHDCPIHFPHRDTVFNIAEADNLARWLRQLRRDLCLGNAVAERVEAAADLIEAQQADIAELRAVLRAVLDAEIVSADTAGTAYMLTPAQVEVVRGALS